MTSFQLRKEMIRYAQRLDQKGFVANHDGNLSCRMSSDRFLATPTARGKFDLSETDLIVVDLTGKTRAGDHRVFGEWVFHAEVYNQSPEVTAVVHAHSPHASVYGLAGQHLMLDFWPEAIVSLGLMVPCITSTSSDATEALAKIGAASRRASAALVQGNGAFAWGTSLEQAYLRLELLEHLTQIYTLAQGAGTLRHLPPDQVLALMEKRKKAGLSAPEENMHG